MVTFVKFFGIAIALTGLIFLINPMALKQYISFWKKERRIRAGGVLTIPVGIIFLIAAPRCRLAGLITILGIWSIIKGVLLLTLRQRKINAYLNWWLNRPDSAASFLGIIALAFGVLIVYGA
jgi:uncharacterized membrane protein HdeD (DUF308 family)